MINNKLYLSITFFLLTIIIFNIFFFKFEKEKPIPPITKLYFNSAKCDLTNFVKTLTYSLIHTNLSHFYCNLVYTLMNLIFLELFESRIKIIIIIFTSSITGALLFNIYNDNTYLIGSSCISYGLAGASLIPFIKFKINEFKIYIFTNKHENQVIQINNEFDIPNIIFDTEQEIYAEQFKNKKILTGIFCCINLFGTIASFIIKTDSNTAHSAHLGGFINGILLALILFKPVKINLFEFFILIAYIIYLIYLISYYFLNDQCSNSNNNLFIGSKKRILQ